MHNSCIPCARGYTLGDTGLTGLTLDATSYLGQCGVPFQVLDTVHGTGRLVTLMPVKNESGGALTVARRFLKFATSALNFGRVSAGYNDAAGGIVVAMDDAYTVGQSIAEHDVFLVVLAGPVYVNTGATGVSLAQGVAVSSDASGYVQAATSTAGQFVAGTLDAATTAEATAVVVHMAGNLAMPPALG